MLPRRRRGVLIHVKGVRFRTPRIVRMTPVPSYLAQTYWWAYVHANAALDALDLWRHELAAWLPHDRGALRKRTLFGGLYQLATITVPQGNAP